MYESSGLSRIFPAALLFLLVLCGCTEKRSLPVLRKQIEETLQGCPGRFAVAFKNLDNGDTLFINPRQSFHAASTMKVPVMVEVFRQAGTGGHALDDTIRVYNTFHSIVDGSPYRLDSAEDSELELYRNPDRRRTFRELVEFMIISSSNLATNILIDQVGAQKVTETMRAMGLNDLTVWRGVEDDLAYRKGMNNTVTAFDLMLLMEAIGRGTAVDPKASGEMTNILLRQAFNDMIPARLPADVRVAHKTGWITGLHHDAGIVILPDGKRYVLVLLSADLTDEKKGVETLAKVSEMVYRYVTAP